jgi:hypothetical protein
MKRKECWGSSQPGIQIVARCGAQNALMRSVQRRQSSDADKLRG